MNKAASTRPEPAGSTDAERSAALLNNARTEIDALFDSLGTRPTGLTAAEARQRLARYGFNEIDTGERRSALMRLLDNVRNPLVILLVILGIVSYFTGDMRGTVMIGVMVLLGVVLRFVQEMRSDKAAEKLKTIVGVHATVMRDNAETEIPAREIVPGDIVILAAGDIVPADMRLIDAHDLHVDQSTLTGESLPVAKNPGTASADQDEEFELPMLCFQGSSVQTGSAKAVALLTGSQTFFGSLARSISGERSTTSFDSGINKFTWLIIRFMMILVPLVFLLNGLSRGAWVEAFLFALAVAVGLTPEMLPMIVTVNLSKGAIAMSKRKVIVKRLNSIQNLGAMDVLCTDKTGTLTQGKIELVKHVDVEGNDREEILHDAYLNSFFETGLKNTMDVAILERAQLEKTLVDAEGYTKIDEMPFDFERRRLSVVIANRDGVRTLICKGAVEEVMAKCNRIMVNGRMLPLDGAHHYPMCDKLIHDLSEQGFRVVALARKEVSADTDDYSVADESDMVLTGFLAFLDPPKDTAKQALEELRASNVTVKILTGDNDIVTHTICNQVNLTVEGVLLGAELERMSDEELAGRVEGTTIFAKLSPSHKQRVIKALQGHDHVVGFMGDGINDAPALKTSDVGISVNGAADIARESSDIILLEQSLLVLHEGVMEGRRVFGNVIKYIRMAASSNFGNMFSLVGASIFLPFVPMLPVQVLTNNLLYDFSQTTIPTDSVDADWLRVPRKWAIKDLRRFILAIGPISSIFDYATFFIMLYVFDCWHNEKLFHTGWFVESVFTQTLIIHVIRTNKVPFIESRASLQLTITSILIVVIAALLPFSPLAGPLGFVPLPGLYWPLLAAMMVCYVVLTQIVKTYFVRRFEKDRG
ncbi:MAG TPA: magnesium-translocating P-type ATPase [Candidatus Kapabacteria bacterium]|nr:magnesium-translocating P-type ATPase [Candidatus Kapabacteria bacterium]